MKGVVFQSAGAQPEVTDSLDKPDPSPDQILVKSLYTAINPVDSYMSGTGLLVTAWPFVLGCDAAGVVEKVGDNASSKFKVGDEVSGCTRLGVPGHSTAQEYFLMDAALVLAKPHNVTIQQAATLGVGTYTAALGLFNGLKIPLPDLDKLPEEKSEDEAEPKSEVPPVKEDTVEDKASKDDGAAETKTDAPAKAVPSDPDPKKEKEWIVILGGASSVGKYAIQIAKSIGFNVAASCSASSAELVRDLSAVPFDYKKPLEEQVKDVLSITSNKPYRIFDAAATGDALAKELFKAIPDDDQGEKLFTTTNDWGGLASFEGGKTDIIALGPIGRPEATELNDLIKSYIPIIKGLIEKEKVIPNPYDIVGQGGFESVIEALQYQQKGAGGSNKVLAKIAHP